MFDDCKELSLNRLLEVPDETRQRLKSDLIREKLEDDRPDTFFDLDYLQEIRLEISRQRVTGEPEAASTVEGLITIEEPRGILGRLLHMMGWRHFTPPPEVLLDIAEQTDEIARKSAKVSTALEEIQQAIDVQVQARARQPQREAEAQFQPQREAFKRALDRLKRFYLKAPYVIGVDVGNDSIKYCQIHHEGDRIVMDSYGIVSLPEIPEKEPEKRLFAVGNMLPRLVREEQLQVSDIHAVFSDLPSDMRFEVFPKVPPDELEELIRFKIQQAFPEKDGPRVIRHLVLDTSEDGQTEKIRALIASAPQAEIERRLRILEEAGMRPAHFTFSSLAVWEGFRHFQKPEDLAGGTFILDIGAHSTLMMFFQDGIPQFNRRVLIGGRDFTTALAGVYGAGDRQIELTREQAEKMKQEFGIPIRGSVRVAAEGVTYEDLMRKGKPALERFVTEVLRTADLFRARQPDTILHHVYLIGGGALQLHLEELLSNSLGIPVRPLHVFEHVGIGMEITSGQALAQDSLRLIGALGVAMAGNDAPNFLQYTVGAERRQRVLTLSSGIAAAALLCTLGWFSWTQGDVRQRLEENLAEAQGRMNQLTSGQRALLTLEQERETLQKMQQDLEAEMQRGQSRVPAAEALRIVSRLIPATIQLDYLKFEPNAEAEARIILGGRLRPDAAGPDPVYEFLLKLEHSQMFQRVVLSKQQVETDGAKPDFVIECAL